MLSRVLPCSASASRREPCPALRCGAGLTPERARAPAVGTGGARRTPALGGGPGGRGGARVPTDQPGSWPLRAARAATHPVRHAPAAAPQRRPLAPRRPSDPGPAPRAPRAWSRTCSAPSSTGCCCPSRSWLVSGGVRGGLWSGTGSASPLPVSGPAAQRGWRGEDRARAGGRGDSPGRARPWAPAFQKHESAGEDGAPSQRQAGRAAAGWRADGTRAATGAGGERPPERAARAYALGR